MSAGDSRSPRVTSRPYGLCRDGRPVTAYTLANNRGASVTILDFGGTITEIQVPDRDGRLENVVLSFDGLPAWEAMGHVNAITGRFANRIRNGFTLDGTHYALPADAEGVTLHGGPERYSTRLWSAVDRQGNPGASLTLRLESQDGDQGFPGHLTVDATYHFSDENTLRLDFEARTDRPTTINLTNHIYFNLGGDASRSVSIHDLQLFADTVAVTDQALVPTGEIRPVRGTAYDFTQPTVLATRLTPSGPAATPGAGQIAGLDTTFVLSPEAAGLDRVAARLHDPQSGRLLEVRTTEPAIQVYTIGEIPEGLLSDAGVPFAAGPAVALETQHLPDSPNRPEFPNTVLRPGEVFRSTTLFGFRTDQA